MSSDERRNPMTDPTHPPVLDLSMNETPFPPPDRLRALVADEAARLNRYPSNTAATLVGALAERLAVPAARVLVGPGSAGLCQHLLQAAGAAGGEVVHAALSFEAYPLLIANAGARPVPVPLHGFAHDLDAMAAAITPQTRVVLVCTPNNPTGAALDRVALTRFLDRVPAEVTVVVDEAYREFATDPDLPEGVELARDRDNVCVLRTFSKAYGLAALRIGYAVVPARIAGPARMLGAVFFPNSLAQAAALAALDPEAEELTRIRCRELAGYRDALGADLAAAGLPVAPSQANFLWLPLGPEAEPFAEHCTANGILVRAYPGAGVRVTVGDPDANRRLHDAARTFVAATTAVPAR
ncbi:aminotransferase class I/II-fold pyridoxal phosphate-dependent enzyme [Micromonospora sp. NPDC050417]|uniref:aminotransferase class I/II-fold pyridoxal phosphate-dependent enzyme n=1 Tax=Micromonospora sp. NPDC050417 TaxID=3364280 RepID=UPI0037B358F7